MKRARCRPTSPRHRLGPLAIAAALVLTGCGREPEGPPADAAALLREGWDAVDRDDAAGARRAIRGLRELGRDDRAALLQARLLVARGFAAAALDILAGPEGRQGIEEGQETGRLVRLVRAEIAYRTRRYREAERDLVAVLAADPDAVDAHRLLAAMYYDAGAIPQAIRHLEETARLAPSDPRPVRLLGLIHADYERYDDAVARYVESLARGPDQPDREVVLREMAACEIKLRRHREALATLDRLAEPTPAAEVLRAECLLAIGDRAAARRIVDRVRAADPDDLEALVLDGTILLEDGDAAAAVTPLARAVAAHPHEYLARFRLAQACDGAGREGDAAREYAEAERIRKTRKEFSELHQAAWDAPGDAAVRRRLAAVAASLGRPDREAVWLDAARAIDAGED